MEQYCANDKKLKNAIAKIDSFIKLDPLLKILSNSPFQIIKRPQNLFSRCNHKDAEFDDFYP